MKLSLFARYVAAISGLALSAYLASWWLHENTLLSDHLSFKKLFSILSGIILIIVLAIQIWPTWYRRLAWLVAASILGAEAMRWVGSAYAELGEEGSAWISIVFGQASEGTAAGSAFMCITVLACLDFLERHGGVAEGFLVLFQPRRTAPETAQDSTALRPLSYAEAKARSRYLDELREDVEARLKESIHNARFIDLGLEDNPTATRLPFRYKSPEQQEFSDIEEAFDAYRQRMLILGAPGSGKTTTLLHIVKQLIDAADDPNAPVPLVVNLSKFDLRSSQGWFRLFGEKAESSDSSRDRSGDFERWLEREFDRFPGITRDLARTWINEQRVAVMLDGLDEVDDEYRFQLVEVLNRSRIFQMDVPLVLCSRIHEYDAIQSRGSDLHLPGAVTLQPLTREQIDDYLDAAQAATLKQALPADDALYEMAETPLTLSMMTLAYGGMASEDISKNLSLTDRRHHLMEAYVSSMLQRKERRDRGLPFDRVRENDVPEAAYRYAPAWINRYLSWLAISLSIRMQTAFSMGQFYPFMTRELERDQRSSVHWSTSIALATLLAAGTAIVGIMIMPSSLQASGMLAALSILAGVLFLFADQGGGEEVTRAIDNWLKIAGNTILFIAGGVIVVIGSALLSETAATLLPIGWSPLAIGQLTICALIALLVLTDVILGSGVKSARWWFVGSTAAATAIAVFVVNIMQLDSRNGLLISGTVIATQFIFPAWHFIKEDGINWMVALLLLLLALIPGVHALCIWMIGEPQWYHVAALVTAIAVLVLGFDREMLPSVILFFFSAAMAGLVDSHSGIVITSILFWYLALVVVGIRRLSPFVSRLTERLQEVAVVWWLSPTLKLVFALLRALPLRWTRFLDYTSGALLLKRSADDIEFVHRMLRDHFALRELAPAIRDASDFGRRLDLIQNMGFQGEAALNPLSEYADHADPDIRVVAIKALARVSHPAAHARIQAAIDDDEPRVRCAAVQMCRFLPGTIAKAIIERALIDPDGSVQAALPASAARVYFLHERAKILLDLLSKTRMQDVLAEIIAHLLLTQLSILAEKMPEWAWRSLGSILRHPDSNVRQRCLSLLSYQPEHADFELIARACEDASPEVRTEALGLIKRIGGDRASRVLNAALSDRDENVRKAALKAILDGRDLEERMMMEKIFEYRDPKKRIRKRDVRDAARKLALSEEVIRAKYEALSDELGLKLQWRRSR